MIFPPAEGGAMMSVRAAGGHTQADPAEGGAMMSVRAAGGPK